MATLQQSSDGEKTFRLLLLPTTAVKMGERKIWVRIGKENEHERQNGFSFALRTSKCNFRVCRKFDQIFSTFPHSTVALSSGLREETECENSSKHANFSRIANVCYLD